MKRIRKVLESIAFAGLKPSGGPSTPKKQSTLLGPVQGRVERFLSGGPAPNDPLYLSNRSTSEKMKTWALIGIPCLVLAAGIAVTLYVLEPPESKPIKQPTAAEITASILPNVDANAKVAPRSDIEVLEIRVRDARVTGIVHNTSKRDIASADLVIELTNDTGSQVGAINATVERIPALGKREFGLDIKQRDAAFALVREIHAK